jgi:hypothetical protein
MMKKLLIGLVLCAGLAKGQNASIKSVVASKNVYDIVEGDTIGFYVTFSKKLTNERAYALVGNASYWQMMSYASDARTQTYSLKDSLKFISGATYYGAIPSVFTHPKFVSGGYYAIRITVINQPDGYIMASNEFQINQIPTGIEDSFLSKTDSKLVAMYDVQGRKVENAVPGTLVIAVFDDGRRKKLVIGQ